MTPAEEAVTESEPFAGLSCSYDPGDNKIRLRSLNRLDAETYARVRAAGFIFAPKQDLFVAPMWTPEREDLMLELCGEIGDEDTSLVDRAEQRADRFEDYSEKRADDAERAHAAVAAIADHIPLGQPIICGHSSEKHARRDAERIRSGMTKAVKMWETSKYWTARAAGALRHAKYKELPAVRQRRIKTLEADKRRHERDRDRVTTFAKLWNVVGLTHPQAMALANHDNGAPFGTWSSLDRGGITPEQAKETVLANHARAHASAERWIAHLDNRLAYERAMLGDIPEPMKPKRALAPMANYPGEGFDHTTKAEYAKMHRDYKGTRMIRGARVRTWMSRGALLAVYLTDSKRVDPPGEGSDVPPRFNPRPEPEFCTSVPKAAPEPNAFDAMRASLKAGVQVVAVEQLFPTPPELARMVVDRADVAGHRVLEPSAGLGALVAECLSQGARTVRSFEISEKCCEVLRRMPYTRGSHCPSEPVDFLAIERSTDRFDRIVMNPPFADGQDVVHVTHAFTEWLAPGGRLVAIMSAGVKFRQDRATTAFRELVTKRGGTLEDLPEDSFKTSGTSVRTVLVTLEKR